MSVVRFILVLILGGIGLTAGIALMMWCSEQHITNMVGAVVVYACSMMLIVMGLRLFIVSVDQLDS